MNTPIAVVYMDDGPSGPCGQSVITTSPRTNVYLFSSEDDAREWIKARFDTLPKRKRARVVMCYPTNSPHHDSNSVEWATGKPAEFTF